MTNLSRRDFLIRSSLLTGGLAMGFYSCTDQNSIVLKGIHDFIIATANSDGSFRPGIDKTYKGTSDTGLSGIAAPVYATILCRTFGWDLPYRSKTIDFLKACQKPDGAFYAPTGSMDMNSPLAKLYNTVQGVAALKIMGTAPDYDPVPVMDYFFTGSEYENLPLYTTSFFPLFYSALGQKMPETIDSTMRSYILREQKDDGYLQDHVAATFHAVHYFRLTGRPVPRASAMVERVLRDQKNDGSWHLHEPDWDVHACFDALFILRQAGDISDPRISEAYKKANEWILECRKTDGGFTHFPDEKISDMDAVYFHAGALAQTGYLKMVPLNSGEEILGWGHAMKPGKKYSCL